MLQGIRPVFHLHHIFYDICSGNPFVLDRKSLDLWDIISVKWQQPVNSTASEMTSCRWAGLIWANSLLGFPNRILWFLYYMKLPKLLLLLPYIFPFSTISAALLRKGFTASQIRHQILSTRFTQWFLPYWSTGIYHKVNITSSQFLPMGLLIVVPTVIGTPLQSYWRIL